MAKEDVIVRFEKVSFEFGHKKPILDTVDFSVRRGSKITLMGQNGAGKSTIFHLISGDFKPEAGDIQIMHGLTIAMAKQVVRPAELDYTLKEFFEKFFTRKVYDIDPKIEAVLDVVNLDCPHDRVVRTLSGGQQARLLLASALIQDPDLLLLDEPTNNLDKAGIEHLTKFLINYDKSCIVISHDAGFLNSFTEGVLYLDVFTKKVDQYVGNYFDVRDQIAARLEKEERLNAQLAKTIQEKKDKANFFANKGGRLRLVARRMRDLAEELEEEKVDSRKEDKTIRPFVIPMQEDLSGVLFKLESFSTMVKHKIHQRKAKVELRRNQRLLLAGPNGIGKSTLLKAIARGTAKGSTITPGVKVGYYEQDFRTLNFEETVFETLLKVSDNKIEEHIRKVAAGFLITGDAVFTKIGNLSEGQKGLVAFARLVLEKPGLLLLDEPTNHINFRHIPVIAEAINKYTGAMILVSHVPEFVSQIRIDQTLELDK
ncbi:MAG: ABC-F family ATP-binding cassette domain-containing protein [Candidatus Vogelbacteria bacterium]|nr:ABC-F family ATP-binding cassette domain-containing protein [Candidatus Vogelbacteria bacterium]